MSGTRELSHGGPHTDEMTRDDSPAAEWERAVSGVLTSIRGHYAAVADQMRADGAEAYEFVTSRIAERLLPCPVTVRLGRDTTAVEVQLSAAPWSFAFDSSASETDLLMTDDQNVILIDDPATSTVTIYAESPAWLTDHAFIVHVNLKSIFDAMAIEEEDRLQAAQEQEFEAIGYRELRVRPASGDADRRWEHFAKKLPDGPRPIRQTDLLAYLPPTRTLVIVPDDIESIVQSARLLLSHSWEQWEFFSLAEQQSLIALESSGRRIAKEWHEQGAPVPMIKKILRSNPALVSWLEIVGLLTPWESRQALNLFELRNELIHTPFAQTHLDTWATDIVIRAVRLINTIWRRSSASSAG